MGWSWTKWGFRYQQTNKSLRNNGLPKSLSFYLELYDWCSESPGKKVIVAIVGSWRNYVISKLVV